MNFECTNNLITILKSIVFKRNCLAKAKLRDNGNADLTDFTDFRGFFNLQSPKIVRNPCSSAKSVKSAFPLINILALAK